MQVETAYFMTQIPANATYDQLTKEELIQLLEKRDLEQHNAATPALNKEPNIKRIISEVLLLLFNEEEDPIKKAMHLLLDYFNADWGYVAIFEEDGLMANFPYEVMSAWVKTPKENLTKLTYETIPWIINKVKAGQDIVFCDINHLPPEAFIDKILLEEQQLKSMLIIPLTFHNEVKGFIGFDSVRIRRYWTQAEVEDMHLIASIFSIIIERWQAENNLEESRKHLAELGTKFQQFFNNLPIGVELYDLDGFLIDVNDADVHIFGSTREELIGVNLFENPTIPAKILNNIRNGKAFSFPLIYDFTKIQEHRYFPFTYSVPIKYLQVKGIGLTDSEFGRIGYLLIVSDNTDEKLKDEQTQNNLAILKAVLLSGHSLIGEYHIDQEELFIDPFLNDNQNNNILFNHLKTHSHLPLAELEEITSSSSNGNYLMRMVEGKLDHGSFVCKTIIENEITWVRVNAQAYKYKKSKRPAKIICHITNITEEKLLEEKLRHAEYETRKSELEMQKIKEADKLKSAFLANMSHEIRTPLNAIVGFSNILAEIDDMEEKQEYIKIINKNSDLLLRLITDILDFSKIESGVLDYSYAYVNLKEICAEQFQVHSLKVSEEINLICPLDTLPDLSLYTDPKRVTQVISNLISNAIKFTEKGTITLSYQIIPDFVRVEVVDTGIGISTQKIHTIFDRFVKINSFMQGTGLGLTICKTIVEALNGDIGVESEPGKGSRFWFTLPL